MMKNNGRPLLAALACGSLFVFAAAQKTAAQVTRPAGSYTQTCSDIRVEGARLSAGCRGKGASTVEKALGAGEKFTGTAVLENFYECDGDIWNNDGQLGCNRNGNHARLKQARAAIDHGLANVFNKKAAGGDHAYWLAQMFSGGLMPKFYAGMTNADAISFLGKHLAKPDQGALRAAVVDAAFKDTYGYGASPKDLAFWNAEMQAGRGGYSYIIFVERPKLNGDKVIRRLMITNAYKKAMGRVPAAGDYDYWQPRQENFKEVVDAARAYLYSSNGAKDLAETVARALEAKSGAKPTTQQINAAVVKYSPSKAIFDEM